MLNILWFRRDLRVNDHQPLLTAVAEGLVAPIVIVEPEYWAQPFASARQWRFAARAITALRSQLAVIGAPLVVRVGDAIETIEALQEKSKDVAIWSHDTTGSAWEVDRDARVAAWTTENGVPWHRFSDTGAAALGPNGQLPAFRSSALPPPDLMIAHGVTPGRIVSERILYLDEDPCEDLPGGPAGARRILDTFMSLAEADKAGNPEVEETLAGLAPHLAWGALSVREAWFELERLKPDCAEIACMLQDRLVKSWGQAGTDRVALAAELSVEQIESALSDVPILAQAFSSLRERGLIREDLLAMTAQVVGGRLGLEGQAILDALAALRTAYVESRDAIGNYPTDTRLQGLTDASTINAALG